MNGRDATPERLLDEARAHPEWDEPRTSEQVDRLIGGYPPDRLAEAVLPRLAELGEGDGEIVLRLVEALARPDLYVTLADALVAQPDLPPDRLWMALGLLEGTGTIEARPQLAEWRDEWEELLGDDRSIEQLVAELDGDPESVDVAIEGLKLVEPEVREAILAGLAEAERGPGVQHVLRYFASEGDRDRPTPNESTAEIATAAPVPRIVRSVVESLDREGRGRIALCGASADGWFSAVFLCDVNAGIREVRGEILPDPEAASSAFRERTCGLDGELVHDDHALAVALLSGVSWLGGGDPREEVGAWLVRVAGVRFRPRPLFDVPGIGGPTSAPVADAVGDAWAVLRARPEWRDESELLESLAVELTLKDGDLPPDPNRDPGPYRMLFEGRILGRIDRYRRMLAWSALAWEAAGREGLARAAKAMASQLADPQNAVPGHPFLSALMTRSLTARQDELRAADPRARRLSG